MPSDAELQALRSRLEKLYEELSIIEQQLHPVVTRLRMLLGDILGIAPPPPAPPAEAPAAEAPRLIVPEAAAPQPTAPAPQRIGLEDIHRLLSRICEELSRGVVVRSYTKTWFFVAPAPITYEGASCDLYGEWDAVLLVPTIDAQISVNAPVEPSTPVVHANSVLNLDKVKVRTVYYKGVTPGLVGKLRVYAFKY